MSEGFSFFDIILFAGVAAFILLRLRSVLGKRTGHERRPASRLGRRTVEAGSEKIIRLGEREERAESASDEFSDVGDSALAAGLSEIKLGDPSFTRKGFLKGARAAFDVVVGAYAADDTGALRPILADDVYRRFARAIRDRAASGQTLDTVVVSSDESEIIEAGMSDGTAMITVRFVTHQMNVTRDSDGKVIEGNAHDAVEVVDIWTFERDTSSRDPNWQLVATRSPN